MLCFSGEADGETCSNLSPRLLARRLFKRHHTHNSPTEDKQVSLSRKCSPSAPSQGKSSGSKCNKEKEDILFPPPGYQPNSLNTLLLNALDLTAAASDALIRNRKNPWVQLSGHPDCFAPAGPHTVWKRRVGQDDYTEVEAYKNLSTDIAHSLAPKFYREVVFNNEYFIELEDLLQHFHSPYVMDIKMGTRTFLESEVSNNKLRPDLYEKMIKICPDEPTTEENKARAITKLRYMQFRESESSSSNLGFRIDAMKTEGDPEALKKMKTIVEVSACIQEFLQNRENVRKKILMRLKEMKQKLEKSEFFRHHEVIGSSLLFLFDQDEKSGVWMIDFAKSSRVPDLKLTHRDAWVQGNSEDGYLTGLDNLISIFNSLNFKKKKT